jgi:hypothetical protein
MQCGKKIAGGSRCRGRALTGKKYCLIHSKPGKAAELGRRGGHRRTVYSADRLKDHFSDGSRLGLLNCGQTD